MRVILIKKKKINNIKKLNYRNVTTYYSVSFFINSTTNAFNRSFIYSNVVKKLQSAINSSQITKPDGLTTIVNNDYLLKSIKN